MSDDQETDGVHVIQEQPKTEIYWGEYGHVVIKQFGLLEQSEDIVLFHPLVVPELIRHIQAKWKEYCEAHDLPLVLAASPAIPPTPTPDRPAKKKGGTR